MAITYSMSIDGLKVTDAGDNTDAVYIIYWRYTGIEDSFSGEMFGSVQLDVENISGFTAFDDITKDQMTQWVINALNSDNPERKDVPYNVSEMEQIIADKINRQKTAQAVRTKQLPWK